MQDNEKTTVTIPKAWAEWLKTTAAHYGHDMSPSKIVQGLLKELPKHPGLLQQAIEAEAMVPTHQRQR